MLWFGGVQRVWPWDVDVDVWLAYGVPSTCCISSWCHQMDLHRYAFWTYQRASNFHHIHPWCQQHLEGACQTEQPTNQHWYEHLHYCWWYCKLGGVSHLRSCIYVMPTQSVPSLQSFTQPLQEPFFPPCFEFVGIDVCLNRNCPAKLKHWLLETWPAHEIVRNVLNCISFCQFYSCFSPNFEICVELCGVLSSRNIPMLLSPIGCPKHKKPGRIWRVSSCPTRISSTLIIANWLYCERISPAADLVLSYFSQEMATCLPKAAQDFWDRHGFSFMTKGSTAALHHVCFRACLTQGNKVWLHSHLEEGFSRDYAINKCQQYIFDQRLSGSQTTMPLSSFCPMRVVILQCCVCRCALCVGMWTLCISWTQSSLMPTTGHILALTLTLTHCFASASISLMNFKSHTQSPQIFPCNPRTCLTTAGHDFKGQLLTQISQQIAHSRPVNRYCPVYRSGSYLSLKYPSSICGDDAFGACCTSFLHSHEFRSSTLCTPGYAL